MSKLEGNKILKCIKDSMENLGTISEPVNKSPLYNSKIWNMIKNTRMDMVNFLVWVTSSEHSCKLFEQFAFREVRQNYFSHRV